MTNMMTLQTSHVARHTLFFARLGLENQIQTIQNQQGNIFEYLEYLMNGIKKIGGDDIEMPKRSCQDSELL